MLRSRYEFGVLSSGTAGAISAGGISPSIQNSSEYSVLQNIFNECRLVRAVVKITSIAPNSTSVNQSRIMIGTNMLFNGTTFTNPTAYSAIYNLSNPKEVTSSQIGVYTYRMVVPKGLEFSSITGDIPSTATPYAGSPGTVVIYGDRFTSSTAYFTVDVIMIHQLRGRN